MEIENNNSSETYCDDFYLDSSHKKIKSKQLSYTTPIIDKTRANVIKKVQQLPITKSSAEIISKLVINHKIKDVVKVLKISKKSVTIHAKANVENKIFESLKDNDNIVIKVFKNTNDIKNELVAYSMDIADQNEDKRYTCDDMILLRVENVMLIKMIEKTEKLSRVLEKNPGKISDVFESILKLIVRSFSYRSFWEDDACGIKNIVLSNQKWIILNPSDQNNYNNNQNKIVIKNFIDVFNLFREHGMKLDELETIFKKHIIGYSNSWWRQYIFEKLQEQYFENTEIIIRKYC